MSIVSLSRGANLPAGTGVDPRSQLEAASEQFEALFLQQILKQMRKAGDVLSADSPMRSRDLDTMREFYDEVLAEHLSSSKQTGIADLLVRQLSTGLATPEQLEEAQRSAQDAELARSAVTVQAPVAGTSAIRAGAELQRSAFTDPAQQTGFWRRGVEVVSGAWQRGGESFTALVNSVIKHESAGNVAAVSPKGAQGLMQLMPGTAKEMAAKLGVAFDEKRLTEDGEYNKRLGMAYLGEMLDRYDGHQALALAAYNAGPGNVDQWLNRLGDPRTGQVGTEAWVQRVPFAETRNYTRNILLDLRRTPLRVEVKATEPRAELQQALEQSEPLQPGQRLSQVRELQPALNEGSEKVALANQHSLDSQIGLHQSRSAAFAQPIRLDPQGTLS